MITLYYEAAQERKLKTPVVIIRPAFFAKIILGHRFPGVCRHKATVGQAIERRV